MTFRPGAGTTGGVDLRALSLGLAFAVMWSSAFATARVIVAHASPLWALSARFLISGLLAVLVARALGQDWRLPGRQARAVVLFGLSQNAAYLGLNFIAMQWIEASLAVVIAAAMPLLVAALGWAFRGERVSGSGLAGLVLGFVGVATVMGSRLSGGADAIGIALCIAGALALAVATLTLGAASARGNLLMVVGLQMLVGSAALFLIALAVETPRFDPDPRFWAAFLWQIAGPGLAATLIWFRLVGEVGTVRASSFHFLNPAFGVLIAALLLGESLRLPDIPGIAVTMLGILLVQRARVRAAGAPPSG